MIEPTLRRLLEDAINTSTKLAIVLLYAEQPCLVASIGQIHQRVCRDIWSVEQALHELSATGLLSRADHAGYGLAPEWCERLGQFLVAYDEPVRRQEIMQMVAELERYAPYRRLLNDPETSVSSI